LNNITIDGITAGSPEAATRGAREGVSFSASPVLRVKSKTFADVINLRQEPLEEYIGRPERGTATEKYWWTATFGVNWNL
jgi:hypothetical protein